MIIATAGHVDHGKTSLIRQLTGIETDRLPEEKARGLSIDLGFAYTRLPGGEMLGWVDVPGHSRFIANMLAGVGAIDRALLVVAADDGPMPQTQEHLAILELLSIPTGVIVITKIDRVDAQRMGEVRAAIAASVAGTFLEGAAVACVSNVTGEGIDALRDQLAEAAAGSTRRAPAGHFRLAVDRRFTLHGAGLIVTGAAISGSVAVGDRLVVSPAGTEVRVRAIHAQNREARTGFAGQRLALNLTGADVSKESIARGDWVVGPAAHHPTTRIDALLRVLPTEERPLRQQATVHVHLGAADIPARVAILEGRSIDPGQTGFVQLLLQRPAVAVYSDRFVLRDQSCQRTVGGGSVLDPFGLARGRARPGRLGVLRALGRGARKDGLSALFAEADTGVDLNWLTRALNLTSAESEALWADLGIGLATCGSQSFGLTRSAWNALCAQLLETLEQWPKAHPESPGATPGDLRKALHGRHPPGLLAAALTKLVGSRVVRTDGQVYFHAAYQARSEPRNELGERILEALTASGVPPATVNELAEKVGTTAAQVTRNLSWAARRRMVVHVSQHRFFLPRTVAELALQAERLSAERPGGSFRVTDFRDRTGVGRNPSIELLEYFDKLGFTRRQGDDRRVVRSAVKMFGQPGVLR